MLDCITKNASCQAFSKTIEDIKIHKKYQAELSDKLSQAYARTKHWSCVKADRLASCGDFVMVAQDGSIIGANFCKNRFCPVCQWRQSRMIFGHTVKIASYLDRVYPDYRYLLLTVTLVNTSKLSDGLNAVLQGFNNLTHDRSWRKVVKGFLRSLEVTYNDDKKTWHPHIHCILAVDSTYFQGDYLDHSSWRKLWERAARVSYHANVDIRAVKGDKVGAIAEVAKYAVKPSSLNVNEVSAIDVYSELIDSTFKRRMRSYGGVVRKAIHDLGVDLDNAYLDKYEEGKRGCAYMLYSRDDGDYFITDDLREMELFVKNEKV